MGVTEILRILLTIFLSTACIQNVRLFGVYDVRWPFLAEIHTAPLKRFVPSSVLQAVRALRNAPAALAVFLAGVAPVALAVYMFVVVNLDALAQASDIQIERRQVVFLCWMQDLNPGSQTPNH